VSQAVERAVNLRRRHQLRFLDDGHICVIVSLVTAKRSIQV